MLFMIPYFFVLKYRAVYQHYLFPVMETLQHRRNPFGNSNICQLSAEQFRQSHSPPHPHSPDFHITMEWMRVWRHNGMDDRDATMEWMRVWCHNGMGESVTSQWNGWECDITMEWVRVRCHNGMNESVTSQSNGRECDSQWNGRECDITKEWVRVWCHNGIDESVMSESVTSQRNGWECDITMEWMRVPISEAAGSDPEQGHSQQFKRPPATVQCQVTHQMINWTD